MKIELKECEECSGSGGYWLPNDDNSYMCRKCQGIGKVLDLKVVPRYNWDCEESEEGDAITYSDFEEYVKSLMEEVVLYSAHKELVDRYSDMKKKYESQFLVNRVLIDNYKK